MAAVAATSLSLVDYLQSEMERAVSPEGWVMVVGGDVRRTHSELPPLRSNIGVQAAVLHNNQL